MIIDARKNDILVKSETGTHPSPSWSKTLNAAFTSPELSFSTIFFFSITCKSKSVGNIKQVILIIVLYIIFCFREATNSEEEEKDFL